MFDLYEVFEDMEVPDTACDDVKGAMRTPRKLHKIFFRIRNQDPFKRLWPMEGVFGLQDPQN